MFFSKMFMVNFVCFSKTDQIFIFGVFEPFKTLVDQYIVNQKITDTISRDAASDKKQVIETALNAKIKQHNAWNGKNDKENIISFKGIFVFGLMVISVKIPH